MHPETENAFNRDDLAGLKSDLVLARVLPSLRKTGWQIELGKKSKDKIRFGWFEPDGWHPKLNAILEVEAGRATESNAVHRNIVRCLSVPELKHLFMAVPFAYRHSRGTAHSYKITCDLVKRVQHQLPFQVSVIGY